MNLKHLIFIISLSFLSAASQADLNNVLYDHVLNTQSNLVIESDGAHTKFESAIFDEEQLLNNFTPNNVKILNKTVVGNEFEIYIEKKIFGFTKRFRILGTVNVTKSYNVCGANEESYDVLFDLTRSGDDVTEAIAAFSLEICSKNEKANVVAIKSKNSLYYRGRKYGIITEPIAKSVLNDQLSAFFKSVKLTIQSK
jgi:hypothetical protein